jgi:uncharacterized protein (TIGR02246 family)
VTKRSSIFLFLCLISALAFASRAAARSHAAGNSAEESAVRKVLSGLSAADKSGDMAAVLSHYADDAMILPPNAPVLAGQSGVRSFYEILFNNFRVDDVSFDADEIHVAGDWAFAQGFINGLLTPKSEGTPARKLHEKFLIVLHRQSSAWKIYRFIWNSSEPPSPPAK